MKLRIGMMVMMAVMVNCGGSEFASGPSRDEFEELLQLQKEPEVERGVFPVITEMIETPDGEIPLTYELINGQAVVAGDIAIDLERVAERAREGQLSTAKLAVTTEEDHRWPNATVPYAIGTSVSPEMWQNIEEAIQLWQRYTPLRFVGRTDQTDYIFFVERDNDGVSTSYGLGREGGRQQITMDSQVGTSSVMHEIGHAIGLFHEQQRDDRDQYVDIHWGNIPFRHAYNFHKYSESSFIVWGAREGEDRGPYDYDSLMHYPAEAFADEGEFAMTRKDGSTDMGAGRHTYPYLTDLDQTEIRALYCPLIGNDPRRCTPYAPPQERVLFSPEWAIAVSPSRIDLGQVSLTSDVPVQSFTITNVTHQQSGIVGELYREYPLQASIEITSMNFNELLITDSNDRIYDRQIFFLEPGESRTVMVRFFPRGSGRRDVGLRIKVQGTLGISESSYVGRGLRLDDAEGYLFASVTGFVHQPVLAAITPSINFIEHVVALPNVLPGVEELRQANRRPAGTEVVSGVRGEGLSASRACTRADDQGMRSNPARKIFSIQNVGHGPLLVGSAHVASLDGEATFQIVCFHAMPFSLESGGFADGMVEYAPRTRQAGHAGELRICGDNQCAEIELRGQRSIELPAAGVLEVEREEVDFGSVSVGSFKSGLIVLQNTGGAVIRISDISFVAGAWASFELQPITDRMLYPGQVKYVTVWFRPRRASSSRATLRIRAVDPGVGVLAPREVVVQGTGVR